MIGVKELVKPPFANYDIVVYFGAGLFSVPFFLRYIILPLGAPEPTFLTSESDQVVSEIIRVLTILMFIYVLGHLIAYLSSQFIEKAVDRFFGKVSTAILISSSSTKKNRNQHVRAAFKDRSQGVREDNALFSSVVRGVFHAPNFPLYAVIYLIGIFGYFDTRIPRSAFKRAEDMYRKHIHDEEFSTDTKWFKPLEYFVINRMPAAVQRMYNYLVISGLLRSLSFVFLISSWWVLLYCASYGVFGTWPIGGESLDGGGVGVAEYLLLSGASVFCLMGYLKFQRRYAEEAILALAFWDEKA